MNLARALVTSLVELQKPWLDEIVNSRQDVATLLRQFIAGGSPSNTTVLSLMESYGELDGEIIYNYAANFAGLNRMLTDQQKIQLMDLRTDICNFTPSGAFLYSTPIQMPDIMNTDFLFDTTTLSDIKVGRIDICPQVALLGAPININVTVENVGNSNETFNTTVYANSQVIGSDVGLTLANGTSAVLPFVCDAAGFEKGEYDISASVSEVLGETDTVNNHKPANDPVTLLCDGHDLAAMQIQASRTILAQTRSMQITVAVKNYGIFSETTNVTLYVNETDLYTQTISLDSANSTTISLSWNTSMFSKGNYTIGVYVQPVQDEIDTANNRCRDCVIAVTVQGDIDGNFRVDMGDVVSLCGAFGSTPIKPDWDPNLDVDISYRIDMGDIVAAVSHFGQHYP